MHMDFRVYQLTYAGDLVARGTEFYQALSRLSKVPGEHGFEYCITNELDFEENIITGCLSEEYAPDIVSVDDDRNSYIPDVAPYLNTFFAIDLQEKRMIVQHRDYPPNNLDRQQSMTRLSLLISNAFEPVYRSQFNYVVTYREATDEDFIEIFNDDNRVTLLRVKLFDTGRFLPEDAEIFDGADELNRHWIEGWNADESDMHEIVLKAPGRGGNGDLKKSPIAISLLNLPRKEILELNYWTGEGQQTMSRTDFKKFRIRGINIYSQVITAIATISREVYRRRDELRNFRLIQDLE
jgi:hypothetical protein